MRGRQEGFALFFSAIAAVRRTEPGIGKSGSDPYGADMITKIRLYILLKQCTLGDSVADPILMKYAEQM